jgi:hypothetical protein
MNKNALPQLKFSNIKTVEIVLTFDQITKRWYFPETPDLEYKRVVGIQVLYRAIYNKNIQVDNLAYPTILINDLGAYRVTLYEKNKEAPVIENLPLRSLLVMRKNAPGANVKTPGGYIKPFYIHIDVKRSYIDNNFFPFQPYFVPLVFYTEPLSLDGKTYKRGN